MNLKGLWTNELRVLGSLLSALSGRSEGEHTDYILSPIKIFTEDSFENVLTTYEVKAHHRSNAKFGNRKQLAGVNWPMFREEAGREKAGKENALIAF